MGSLATPDGNEIIEAGLRVRLWRPEDADAVHRACQDPVIQRWTSIPRPYRPEHAEVFVGPAAANAWLAGTAAPMGVFDLATATLLGSTGLVEVDLAKGTGEIGYWTAPWARRQGVATAAARASARWALQTLGLTRLAWRAEVGNHAARLVAERIGVRMEGLLRRSRARADGRLVDSWVGSLLAGELLEADAPVDPVARLRAATFGAPPPSLQGLTARGAPLGLRPPQPDDMDAIVAACIDPESVRWTMVPHPYGPWDAVFFIHDHAPSRWARGESAVFAIVDGNDDYAGSVELRIVGPRTGDVGYLVAPWARGQGMASAALRLLCRWGFQALGLSRIEWQAYVGNNASRRVAEKAGFRMEGLARAGAIQRGEYRDAWTAAVLAADS